MLQPHPPTGPEPRRQVGPGFRQNVGVKIDDEHYFAGAAAAGTGMTCPHLRQVRSFSSP